ncbi:MAG: NAD(P)H-dependent oxidoreductase [Lachnospiraceae bacterium]|nr:NAD(P)H-dependent oxidoreductase [Lachnospiraceae bacterium]
MILFVNCCIRSESRTKRLADSLLEKLGQYEEIKLEEINLKQINRERLNKRTSLIEDSEFDNPMFNLAKQWANADIIVIAAPFWDLSFPSELKMYIENIYVTGIVSEYGDDGRPQGLCKAEKLYYVTTAGGPYNDKYGYQYIRDISLNYFGIKETKQIYAEMLDIVGNDPEKILKEAIENITL